jgi:hephaestin
MRFIVAALLLVIGAAHAIVIEDQFERAFYLGACYLGIVIGSVAVAALLSWRDNRAAWLLAGVVAEGGAALFVLARVVKVPQVSDDAGRWTDPLALLATVLALIVLGCAGWAVSRNRPSIVWTASRLPLVSGLVALQLGAMATVAVASIPAGAAVIGATGSGSSDGYWSAVTGAQLPTGVTRTYYIASDEVLWDYAPTGKNQITGQAFDATADTYVKNGPDRIGSKYLKCLYRGYTDTTFHTLAPRPASEAYLGLLGPVIRAAVGDTITVVFRNNCAFPTSVHAHGVFYRKDSEGAPYSDGTSGADKLDDGVPKGGTHTYSWRVPERAGPGPHDGSSVMWMYHSHSDEVGDTYAGLVGPMVITSAAQARPDGTPKDVDRELFVMFSVMNENNSPYLNTNVRRYTRLPSAPAKDDEFTESNLMHSINGYVFGNQPMITIKKGERVRWYVMSLGTEVDLHTPHWHGNDVMVGGMRADLVNLLPASMVVADMVPDSPGIWLFHCHVNDHLTAGMSTRYQVNP